VKGLTNLSLYDVIVGIVRFQDIGLLKSYDSEFLRLFSESDERRKKRDGEG